jgi:glycosyl transferase family 87
MIQKRQSRPAAPQPLQARRPEVLALGLVLMASAIWVLSTPGPLDRFGALKGTDFAQFYASARLVATGHVDQLYNWSVYVHELSSSVPGPEGLLYLPIYPPALALVLAPLGALPYLNAAAIWTFVSAGLYILASLVVARQFDALWRDRFSVALLLIGFPAFQQLLLYGQVSAIALGLVVLAWLALTGGRTFWSGVALGALVFKPQMLTITTLALLGVPSWTLAFGIVAGAAGELLLTGALLGAGVFWGYLDTVRRVLANPGAFEPKAEQIQSLRGFFVALGGDNVFTVALFLIATAAVCWVAARATRRSATPHQSFAIVVLAGLLVNPHLYVYDLVLLVLPLAVATARVLDAPIVDSRVRRLGVAAYTTYWLPLVAPALGLLHVQLMAPAMLWLLWMLRPVDQEPPIGRL